MTLAELTPEQIRTMPPSREMDRLIAVALGVKLTNQLGNTGSTFPTWPRPYSTDHAAAMEALERYCKAKPGREARLEFDTQNGCSVTLWRDHKTIAAEVDETTFGLPGLTLAISIAILLAEKGTP